MITTPWFHATMSSLPSLPETRYELLEIGAALGADQKDDLFFGIAATEERVKSMSDGGQLADYQIISFATHALAPGDIDGLLEPALALSQPSATSTEDGLLSVSDILGLKINADWVILSACNTAAAQDSRESASGLSRAFFYAGARSLLASNWPVETTSTMKLTTSIFKLQAKNPNLSRAKALQQAMINMINYGSFKNSEGEVIFSDAHPIFWAPFTLIDEGG